MTRQKVDPATRAQNALDVATRKLARLDAAISKAEEARRALVVTRPALAVEVEYAAQHPALQTAATGVTTDGPDVPS